MMKLHATHGKANNIVEEYLAEDTVSRLFREKEYIIIFKVLSKQTYSLLGHPIISTIQKVPYCPRTL